MHSTGCVYSFADVAAAATHGPSTTPGTSPVDILGTASSSVMVKIFPGFMMFNGSIAFLMFLITFTCTSPCSAFMYFIFPSPTPCSPVHVPPAANASSTAFLSHAIMVARSDSLYGTSRWKFPSAMWQHMIGGRPHPLNTASVCAITSGKLDKGTQQSPGYTLSASGRSFQSLAAKKHPRRASQRSSILDPSSASVYPVQPCFFAICSVFLASSINWSTLSPWNSKNKVGTSSSCILNFLFVACIPGPFNISHRASEGTTLCRNATTHRAAAPTSLKEIKDPTRSFGRACTRHANWVITPRVPSDPANSCVRSYPAEDFRTNRLVSIKSPFGSTICSDTKFSRDVPYFKVDRPDPLVAAIPPTEGFEDGSGPNSRPCFSSMLFTSTLNQPGPQTSTKSSFFSSICRSCITSSTTPPRTGRAAPSSPVPAPRGTTGIFFAKHNRITACTSATVFGHTTHSGMNGPQPDLSIDRSSTSSPWS
mmetsp:Transcript_33961/g.72052  ORF Transcript_33961/g.72052 Transcript_33961/m.72052 type:complete len:480 (-) Transcript_33961:119-1558(-)